LFLYINMVHATEIEVTTFTELKTALSSVLPGDTIIVRGGTYIFPGKTHLGIPSGTSWDNPVTVRSYPGEYVLFQRQVGTSGAASLRAGSIGVFSNPKYVQIIGEDILETADPSDRKWIFDGVGISGDGDFVRIKDGSCVVRVP
jgi:hypothetical protein